jgi:hypothetical protein
VAVEISLNDIDRGQISAAVNQTLLEGGTVSEWWKNQERSLLTRVTRNVRSGLNNGLTSAQIAQNLRTQVLQGSRAQTQALVNTACLFRHGMGTGRHTHRRRATLQWRTTPTL